MGQPERPISDWRYKLTLAQPATLDNTGYKKSFSVKNLYLLTLVGYFFAVDAQIGAKSDSCILL